MMLAPKLYLIVGATLLALMLTFDKGFIASSRRYSGLAEALLGSVLVVIAWPFMFVPGLPR